MPPPVHQLEHWVQGQWSRCEGTCLPLCSLGQHEAGMEWVGLQGMEPNNSLAKTPFPWALAPCHFEQVWQGAFRAPWLCCEPCPCSLTSNTGFARLLPYEVTSQFSYPPRSELEGLRLPIRNIHHCQGVPRIESESSQGWFSCVWKGLSLACRGYYGCK